VRYESAEEPIEVYVCHCRECRKQSSSAFGISIIVAQSGFRVTQGEPNFWSRPADSGNWVKFAFCPSCGSRLWHQDAEGAEPTLSIKGGSLDEPPDIAASAHIGTSRKLAGVVIPDGARQSPEEPG
jgi:hypothetical protein